MDAGTLLKNLDNIKSLPTLPAIVLQVNELLQNEDTTIQQLQNTIEKDQALVPKILKLVNSSFFGLRSKISNLSHAIILLGFNPIRNAVVSVTIVEAFDKKDALGTFDISQFWRHSVAVAVISKYLAQQKGYHSPEDAFTGGLVHDIGKLVMCQFLKEPFQEVWRTSQQLKLSFYRAEKKVLPLTHARIGAYLAGKWNLPQRLMDTIRYHHKPRLEVIDPTLLMIVHTANQIVNRYLGAHQTNAADPIHPLAADMLSEPLANIEDWYPQQAHEVESACSFFLEATSA